MAPETADLNQLNRDSLLLRIKHANNIISAFRGGLRQLAYLDFGDSDPSVIIYAREITQAEKELKLYEDRLKQVS